MLEVGTIDGVPIFHFHGNGSSRLEVLAVQAQAVRLGVRLIAFLLRHARGRKRQHHRCAKRRTSGSQLYAAHAALLWTRGTSEGRIVSANPLDAKEIEEVASLAPASQTIDAARALAYDAARRTFRFATV